MVLHLDTLLHDDFWLRTRCTLTAGRVLNAPDHRHAGDGPEFAKRTARASAARMTEGISSKLGRARRSLAGPSIQPGHNLCGACR